MREPFLEFEWRVAAGYEWRDWLDNRGQPIVVPARGLVSLESASSIELASERLGETGPVLMAVDTSTARAYRPMQREHAGLFLELAAVECQDTAAIAAFAGRYGSLGLEPQTQLVDGRHVVGESHLAWAREICRINEALRLRQRRALSRQGRERLSWLFNVQLQHVRARMKIEPDDLPPRLQVVPATLLTAMWLQLALATAGEKRFVQCKFCCRFMEISTEKTGFRMHREFCSNVCKTNDYRRRRRMVLDLAGKGMRLKDIAERAETKASTVRGWIASVKKTSSRKTKGEE